MATAYFFNATLSPSRSLDRRGFFALLGVMIALNLFMGLRFAMQGGWPVLPFLGLDVMGVLIAFRLNNQAGQMREHVVLDARELSVTHVDPKGAEKRWTFEPGFARVGISENRHGQGGVTITTHGKGVKLAEFLTEDERREVYDALRQALQRRMAALSAA